jgi:hypothetical protein
MMRVAIMQPTYLPWIGYFGLMQSVDLFILLDSVQFTKRSWQQRNQVKTPNGATWLTVPVLSKGRRDQLIREVEIDHSRDFPGSHMKTLELNYRKAPHFEAHSTPIMAALATDHVLLADLTIGLIRQLGAALGITTPIRRSSELETTGANAEMLASLCDQVGATEYVSPPGSREYLDQSDAFSRHGLPLRYFSFTHPTYAQRFGEFVPYMSIVDLLFNCGGESLDLIKSGCAVAR